MDQATAGVFIKIEKLSARVLSSESTLEKPDVRICTLADMQKKVLSRNMITLDKNGSKVGGGRGAQRDPGCVKSVWAG